MTNQLVTIIGSSYFYPIAELYEKFDELPPASASTVQVSVTENGYAASICILAIACLESHVMRVRYINDPADLGMTETFIPKYLSSLYGDFPYRDELTELLIIRDILLHNHLWEIEYSWGDDPGLIQLGVKKRSRGDKKYQNHIGLENQATKVLGLHVNPVMVGRDDVRKVLLLVWNTLLYLEAKNHNQCYVSQTPVLYKGRSEFVADLMRKLGESG